MMTRKQWKRLMSSKQCAALCCLKTSDQKSHYRVKVKEAKKHSVNDVALSLSVM